MPDFDVCFFDDKPCTLYVDNSGIRSCLLRNSKGCVVQACVRIRFKGMDSVWERGFGMTILEKLERQGIVKFIDEKNLLRLKNRGRRISH